MRSFTRGLLVRLERPTRHRKPQNNALQDRHAPRFVGSGPSPRALLRHSHAVEARARLEAVTRPKDLHTWESSRGADAKRHTPLFLVEGGDAAPMRYIRGYVRVGTFTKGLHFIPTRHQ